MVKNERIIERFSIYIAGLLVMSLGIVLIIVSDFGASPWDVLHVGLYYQFGLTIGSWSVIVGFLILFSSALMTKSFPQVGAYLNMILVGLFIDMYMLMPFLDEPNSIPSKLVMFTLGMIIYAYGMGIYLSAQFGAGPRDSFMLALEAKTGWKVSNVRRLMEIVVLVVGWLLGGPVFIGTIIFSIVAGTFIGYALPQCQRLTDRILNKQFQTKLEKEIERSADV